MKKGSARRRRRKKGEDIAMEGEDEEDEAYTEQDAEAESAMTLEEEEMEAVIPTDKFLAPGGDGGDDDDNDNLLLMDSNTIYKGVLKALAGGTPNEIGEAIRKLRQLQQKQRTSVSELIKYSKFHVNEIQPNTLVEDEFPAIFQLTRNAVLGKLKKTLGGTSSDDDDNEKNKDGNDEKEGDDDSDMEMPSTPLATGAIESQSRHEEREESNAVEEEEEEFSAEDASALVWLVRALEGTFGASSSSRQHRKQQQQQQQQQQTTNNAEPQTREIEIRLDEEPGREWGNVPESLTQCVVALHDMMYPLLLNGGISPVGTALVLEEISQLCEAYWLHRRPGAERAVALTLHYLMTKIVASGSQLSTAAQPPSQGAAGVRRGDVHRAFQMRGAFRKIDFGDEDSTSSLRRLMVRAAIMPGVVRLADGFGLVASFLTLHVALLEELHQAIKCQLRGGRKWQTDKYAAIYFRAWRLAMAAGAGGPQVLTALENDCIQDLMSLAVHVQSTALSNTLARLLSFFHKHKPQQGVDEMLCRLYAPILWRSLSVANPLVRRNAAVLFLDAFPVQDPAGSQREIEEAIQAQCNTFSALLFDPYEGVRKVAVLGVARALSLYWELIPAATTARLLSQIEDLAQDRTSPAVRAAVFDGLGAILENSLAHAALHQLLGKLAPAIHDTSEKVRTAFVALLIAIKPYRAFKFYEIVPLQDLVYCLAHETKPLARKLATLLYETYFPTDSSSALLKRSLILLRESPQAAFSFYSNLVDMDVPLVSICKFIARAFLFLSKSALEETSDGPPAKKRKEQQKKAKRKAKKRGGGEEEEEEESRNKDGSDEEKEENDNKELLSDLFRVTHILYTGISASLHEAKNKELRSKLEEVVMWGSLHAIAAFIGTPLAKTIAIGIGSYIDPPVEKSEVLAQRKLTADLCNLQTVVDSDEYSTLLKYLFSQRGSGEAVLGQMITMLSPEDDGATTSTSIADGYGGSGTIVGCNALLGLQILDKILSVKEVREMAFEYHSQIVKILKTLRGLVSIAMDRVSAGPLSSEEEDDEDDDDGNDESGPSELETVLLLAVTYYAKLLIHFIAMREVGGNPSDELEEEAGREEGGGKGDKSVFARDTFCGLVRWAYDVCLPQAMRYGGMCDGLVRGVAVISAELVVVGLGDETLIDAISELYRRCLAAVAGEDDAETNDFASELLPHISKFIYHLYYYDAGNRGPGKYCEMSLSILEQVLRSLPLSVLEKRLQIQDVINTQSAGGTLLHFSEFLTELALESVPDTEILDGDSFWKEKTATVAAGREEEQEQEDGVSKKKEKRISKDATMYVGKLVTRSSLMMTQVFNVLMDKVEKSEYSPQCLWKALNFSSFVVRKIEEKKERRVGKRLRPSEVSLVKEFLTKIFERLSQTTLENSYELSDLTEFTRRLLNRIIDINSDKTNNSELSSNDNNAEIEE